MQDKAEYRINTCIAVSGDQRQRLYQISPFVYTKRTDFLKRIVNQQLNFQMVLDKNVCEPSMKSLTATLSRYSAFHLEEEQNSKLEKKVFLESEYSEHLRLVHVF